MDFVELLLHAFAYERFSVNVGLRNAPIKAIKLMNDLKSNCRCTKRMDELVPSMKVTKGNK